MKNQNLKKDYFWNTLGVLLQNAISPLLILVVTRVNGIEAVGVFSFAFAVSLMLWTLSMWGGRTYQVSDVNNKFSAEAYVMTRVLLAGVVLIITGLFCYLSGYDFLKTSLIFALVIFKIIESLSDVFYGIIQKHDKLHKTGKSLTVKALLGITAFLVIDLITKNIVWSIIGVVIVNLVVFLAYDIRQAYKLQNLNITVSKLKDISKEALRILQECSGVFIIFFLSMFSLNIPRYFIDIHSTSEVGYFGIIAMPITLIVLVVSFILQPNIVKVSKLYEEKKYSRFKKMTTRLLGVSSLIGVSILFLTMLFGAEILKLIFGIDFSQHKTELNIIVLGGVASALVTVYLNIFVVLRKIKLPVVVLLITNLLLIPSSFYAVKEAGMLGGVIAFALTNGVQLLIIGLYFKTLMSRKHGQD